MKRRRLSNENMGDHPQVRLDAEAEGMKKPVRPAPQRRRLAPFKAADFPRKDSRGEVLKNGVKWRV